MQRSQIPNPTNFLNHWINLQLFLLQFLILFSLYFLFSVFAAHHPSINAAVELLKQGPFQLLKLNVTCHILYSSLFICFFFRFLNVELFLYFFI